MAGAARLYQRSFYRCARAAASTRAGAASLSDFSAAVHNDCLTGYILRVEQIQHCANRIFRTAKFAQWSGVREMFCLSFVPFGWQQNGARRNRINADLRSKHTRERFGHLDDAKLRDRVRDVRG